jgi:hypothetical protein
MKIYHGASEKQLKDILQNGIRPRSETGVSNWEHTSESNPDAVYLTKAYAGYFAACASQGEDRWVIIEIDTEKLDKNLFYPDEDFIAQAMKNDKTAQEDAEPGSWGMISKMLDLNELTTLVRDHIEDFQHLWVESLEYLGNCCYIGSVPVEAITRIGLFDPKSNWEMAMAAQDPTITTLNYQICGDHYQALTRWLVGDKLTPKEYEGQLYEMKKSAPIPGAYEGYDFDTHTQKMLDNQQIEIIIPEKEKAHA